MMMTNMARDSRGGVGRLAFDLGFTALIIAAIVRLTGPSVAVVGLVLTLGVGSALTHLLTRRAGRSDAASLLGGSHPEELDERRRTIAIRAQATSGRVLYGLVSLGWIGTVFYHPDSQDVPVLFAVAALASSIAYGVAALVYARRS
jgi:hypothetical protein